MCMTDPPATRAEARTETIMRATLDLARELGYAKLSIEAVAARAGVGKHTIYRRWPSKGMLFHDSLLTLKAPAVISSDTGDIMTDLRRRMHATVDLMSTPPWGPLYRALLAETQHDPAIAASVTERFIRPQTETTIASIVAAKDQGQISADFDLDLGMALFSGPLYFRLLVTQEPLTYDFVDRILHVLFAGLKPRP
jgi:AcrR family transcriptional regulator